VSNYCALSHISNMHHAKNKYAYGYSVKNASIANISVSIITFPSVLLSIVHNTLNNLAFYAKRLP